ncbi:hypothetical protein [Kordiimonas sp.]|uniref:hypothetical protein n=1 Tax=Kordiimonas sp. TaxID=1970157 RepID=UPI003B52603F
MNESLDFKLRCLAKESLTRAKKYLAETDNYLIRSAALELRLAIESIVYSRAYKYRDELSCNDLETWQPRKVLDLMLAVNPIAWKGTELSLEVDDTASKTGKRWVKIGAEVSLTLQDVKKHYDALGSFLHTPTLAQLSKSGSPDFLRMRKRCIDISDLIESVLNSNMWNIRINVEVCLPECLRCDQPLRIFVDPKKEVNRGKCFNCGAGYTIKDATDGSPKLKPHQSKIPCVDDQCHGEAILWTDQIVVGYEWACPLCGLEHQISFCASEKAN